MKIKNSFCNSFGVADPKEGGEYMQKELDVIETYRTAIKRVVWRLQNKERSRRKHEVPLEDSFNDNYSNSFTNHSDQKILVQQLFDSITSETGKRIIYEIYFNNKTEAQVAQEMNITRQAVNKWKNKTLKAMRKELNC